MNPIVFVDQSYISTTPLNSSNVLEYFSRSPFYDSSCTNEILKMQNQYRGITSFEGIEKLNGMYYALEYSSDFLFIIRCSLNSNGVSNNLKFFYIIHGYIYEGPNANSLYKNRINNIFWYLNKILDYHIELMLQDKKETNEINNLNCKIQDTIVQDVLEILKKEK